MDSLRGKRVLITGVGIKKLEHVFKDITTDSPSHTEINHEGVTYKANIGAAVAFECAQAGAVVHIVSRTEDKLKIVKEWIEESLPGATVEYTPTDLSNLDQCKQLVDTLKTDLPLYWVQSVGLGAGTVKVKDDNPYLLIEDIPNELIEAEMSVLTNTVTFLQLLLPKFKKQKETRVCIISSMSAIRSVVSGSMHMAAKGAISRFANAATIELNQDNIFITDVRPGIVDTGMYDSDIVQETVSKMGERFGYNYSKTGLRCAPPSAVGKAIVTALTSDGHITSLNMVARGQWPQEGS